VRFIWNALVPKLLFSDGKDEEQHHLRLGLVEVIPEVVPAPIWKADVRDEEADIADTLAKLQSLFGRPCSDGILL